MVLTYFYSTLSELFDNKTQSVVRPLVLFSAIPSVIHIGITYCFGPFDTSWFQRSSTSSLNYTADVFVYVSRICDVRQAVGSEKRGWPPSKTLRYLSQMFIPDNE
ncbi:hypothetical protein PanWU01x14_300200 [Parasponia andersonii]|uniref:Uncharacterized protein n=1 Tax=Parasponia andersonii TaxID=3476 RepID=A0A2P5AU58_PARAD|nr:hypothetical protein PanWU01x14_300200 [Parasponia andersonii]